MFGEIKLLNKLNNKIFTKSCDYSECSYSDTYTPSNNIERMLNKKRDENRIVSNEYTNQVRNELTYQDDPYF